MALFSQVTKVNFEGTRAVGVSFTRYGQPGTVLAKREVILSAGTVGSTQLLLLSGLGPKEELERLQVSGMRHRFSTLDPTSMFALPKVRCQIIDSFSWASAADLRTQVATGNGWLLVSAELPRMPN